MANLASLLKDEIQRLARKEVRKETKTLAQSVARYRSDIAALKRENTELARKIAFLEKQEKKRLEQSTKPGSSTKVSKGNAAADNDESTTRFSPSWLKKHREKLGFSAAQYAQLIDVSPLSIYNWENGKSLPRNAQREALAAVRGIGKREALKRLEMLGNEE